MQQRSGSRLAPGQQEWRQQDSESERVPDSEPEPLPDSESPLEPGSEPLGAWSLEPWAGSGC